MTKENKLLLDLRYKSRMLLPADLAVQVMLHGELIDTGTYDSDTQRYPIELCVEEMHARVVGPDEYAAAYTRFKLRGDKDADS